MSEAALDRLLAVLVVAILATGVLTWRAGSPDTWWLYALHGLLAGMLLVASVVKLRRSLPRALAKRRWRQLLIAAPFAVATLAALLMDSRGWPVADTSRSGLGRCSAGTASSRGRCSGWRSCTC